MPWLLVTGVIRADSTHVTEGKTYLPETDYCLQPPLNQIYSLQTPLNPDYNLKPPLNPDYNLKPPLNPDYNLKPPLNPDYNLKPPLNPDYNLKPPLNHYYNLQPPLIPDYNLKPPLNHYYNLQPSLNPDYNLQPPLNPDYNLQPPLNPDYNLQPPLKLTTTYNCNLQPPLNHIYNVQPSLNRDYNLQPSLNLDYNLQPSLNPDYNLQPSLNPDYNPQRSLNRDYNPQPSLNPDYNLQLVALFYKTLWHLILYYLVPAYYSSGQSCSLDASDVLGILKNGNIKIGAVLPLHLEKVYPTISFSERPGQILCKGMALETYLQLQVVKYAQNEINRNPTILPNISLGFQIHDSCVTLQRELEGTLWMITGQDRAIPNFRCQSRDHLAAIIGYSTSTYSILMAHILGLNRYPHLLYYMNKVNVKLNDGREIFFDVNGNPPPLYDLVNWQQTPNGTMKQVKVGSYGTEGLLDKPLFINTSALQWATGSQMVPLSICSKSCLPGFRKASVRGKPACCFGCIPCPQGEISNKTDSTECFRCPWDEWPTQQKDSCRPKSIDFLSFEEPLGVTLASTSVTSSMIPMAILGLLMYYQATPAVKANNYTLSCLLLISLTFCFLCSLAFIGYPLQLKCLLRQVTFGMVFALCISCILAKTTMVVIAFRATKPNSDLRKWASPQVSYLVMGLGIFMQILICIFWLFFSPPYSEYNTNSQPGVLVMECNEGSLIAFWGTLGYLGFLAILSFSVAFLARRLPSSFNEAKFITFSMLAFLTVWISFIPASLSTRGKYTVAMEIFAIQSSSWAVLCCMFAPKCYIILIHPHMNSRKYLMQGKK
ncbi:uncharacterized protein RCH25_018291 [Pelodytes ibericus]